MNPSKTKEKSTQPTDQKPKQYATVSFRGAQKMRLQGKSRSYPAGKVPPGKYTVYATFAGEEVSVGSITLRAGQKKRYVCTTFLTCE